jgi:hypothetical protein
MRQMEKGGQDIVPALEAMVEAKRFVTDKDLEAERARRAAK